MGWSSRSTRSFVGTAFRADTSSPCVVSKCQSKCLMTFLQSRRRKTAFLLIWQCASGVHGGKKP